MTGLTKECPSQARRSSRRTARALGLGRGGPMRQIAVVWRRADAGSRNIDALAGALAAADH